MQMPYRRFDKRAWTVLFCTPIDKNDNKDAEGAQYSEQTRVGEMPHRDKKHGGQNQKGRQTDQERVGSREQRVEPVAQENHQSHTTVQT